MEQSSDNSEPTQQGGTKEAEVSGRDKIFTKSSGLTNLTIAESVFLAVGCLLLVFCRTVLSHQLPTIPTKPSQFKSLQHLSVKESHLNIAMNTNGLVAMLVALTFLMFSCVIELFKIFCVVTELELDSIRILEMLMGVCIFTIAILGCLNLLLEKSSFHRIVHNQVGKNYSIITLAITVLIVLYGMVIARSLYYLKDDVYLYQSYIQLLIGTILIGLDFVLYRELFYFPTDG